MQQGADKMVCLWKRAWCLSLRGESMCLVWIGVEIYVACMREGEQGGRSPYQDEASSLLQLFCPLLLLVLSPIESKRLFGCKIRLESPAKKKFNIFTQQSRRSPYQDEALSAVQLFCPHILAHRAHHCTCCPHSYLHWRSQKEEKRELWGSESER